MTAGEIEKRLTVSPLRAYRLAAGLTLAEVSTRLAGVDGVPADGRTARLPGHGRVSRWETGREVPSARYLDALCRLYGTRPDLLGFGTDYSTARDGDESTTSGDEPARSSRGDGAAQERDEDDPMRRRTVLQGMLAVTGGGVLTAGALEAVADTRRLLGRTLQARSVLDTTVDWWEAQPAHHAGLYRRVPAVTFLADATLDVDMLQHVLSRRQTVDDQRRLTRVVAQMCGLVGITCIDLHSPREARLWFQTGQVAAEDIGDRALRAWLRTREALSSLYYGAPEEAVTLARSASHLAGSAPSAAAAMAPAVQARALARLGRGQEAMIELRRAEQVFEHLPSAVTSAGVFGFGEQKLRFYAGNVLARAGGARLAQDVQAEALRLCPPGDLVDRGHIWLDRSMTLLRGGEVTEAVRVASAVLLETPGGHGTGAVLAQAHELGDAVPARFRRHPAVQEFAELLAAPR